VRVKSKVVVVLEAVVVFKVIGVTFYFIESSSVEGTMEKDWSSCRGIISLKVSKCEIFDLFDFNYFYVMKCFGG
jgi:hypothetical protein